jgi:hypothetical protein
VERILPMKIYRVYALFYSPDGKKYGRTSAELVFTAGNEVEAIRAGWKWVGEEMIEGYEILGLSIGNYVLPESNVFGEIAAEPPQDFFRWDVMCLLPVDVFTRSFLEAAIGRAAPAQ